LAVSAVNELALLDARPHGCNWIGEEHREDLTETSTDEVFFLEWTLRNAQFLIEYLGALIDIHLNHSREGKNQAQFQSPQKPLRSIVGMDFPGLLLEVFKLTYFLIHI
jgi:hypothetical protein